MHIPFGYGAMVDHLFDSPWLALFSLDIIDVDIL